jgi:sortase (surface protein transpeptidase)
MTVMPRRRAVLSAAVAFLAIGGAAAIVAGLRDRPAPEPPRSAPPALSAPPATAPAPGKAGEALTRGPLLPTSVPTRVAIPALHVNVALATLGRQADGSMQVPADGHTVGWYKLAPTPGSLGPAVLAGHVDFKGKPGSFARISTLHRGDQIAVTRQDGTTAKFAVTAVDRYAKDQFPSAAVYGPIDHAGLRLITCGGPFDSGTGHYVDNIVVYADLRSASDER